MFATAVITNVPHLSVMRTFLVTFIILTCTWYGGNGDGYLGRRHAASWHGQTPEGFGETINNHDRGIALNNVPFGEKVLLEIINVPEWAEENYSHLIGRMVWATVIDRTPGNFADLTPATAKALFGEDYQIVGRVTIRVWRVYEDNRRLRQYLRSVPGETKTTQTLSRKHSR